MQRFDQRHGVAGSVPEIRIAERDVLRACRRLPTDVFEYHVPLRDAEDSLVNGYDRAMPAEVLAAATGLGITHAPCGTVQHQLRVSGKRGQTGAIGRDEPLALN